MPGFWKGDSKKKEASSCPEKITNCPVTGLPLGEGYDKGSGSSCGETFSTSTFAPSESSPRSEAPASSDANPVLGSWVRQQVNSYESAIKFRHSSPESHRRHNQSSDIASPRHRPILHCSTAPLLQHVQEGKPAEADNFKIHTPDPEIQVECPEVEDPNFPKPATNRQATLDIIRQEHQQQQENHARAHRPQRQPRNLAANRRSSDPGPGRWLDSADPPTAMEKQEIHLMYLLLAEFFFDVIFHVVCIIAGFVGTKALHCSPTQALSIPCILGDFVLNFAVGPSMANAGPPKEGTFEIGALKIHQGNLGLFGALAWALFNVTYYCAAACAITNDGSAFRRYKVFTIWCIMGIIGNAIVLCEFRSALNVLIITFRLVIFWRAWIVRHTSQDSQMLLPNSMRRDLWDSLLGFATPVGRHRNPSSQSRAQSSAQAAAP